MCRNSRNNQAEASIHRESGQIREPRGDLLRVYPLTVLDEREKLIFERDQLLQSGMYSEDDPLIQELNKNIRGFA